MTAADLIYDAETHTSRTPDGRNVPHVTAVLRAVGLSTDFDELGSVHPRVAENVRHATARGTAVHADCHAYDDNDLDWDLVDPRVRPFVEAWADARERLRLVPLDRERRLYHEKYDYVGIMDGVFSVGFDRVLVDIKTGDPNDAAAHIQTAAYVAAWELATDVRITKRWAIWLKPGLRVPYRVFDYSAQYLDLQKWLACLTVYNEQPTRRRRIT